MRSRDIISMFDENTVDNDGRFSMEEIKYLNKVNELVSDVAMEGAVRAYLYDNILDATDIYREVKGWFLRIETKRKYINELCDDLIEWLKDKKTDHGDLNLDAGSFRSLFKISPYNHANFYYLLDNTAWNEIKTSLNKGELTSLEDLFDTTVKGREDASRVLKSATQISDLIKITERYKERTNEFFEKILKRKARIKMFPFQTILLGASDLRRISKRIVNMSI